jgi:sRNA-binding protein
MRDVLQGCPADESTDEEVVVVKSSKKNTRSRAAASKTDVTAVEGDEREAK